MAEPREIRSIGDTVDNYMDGHVTRMGNELLSARYLARQLALRMSKGEPFGPEDFIFVASRGEPERYQPQLSMLLTAAKLETGQVTAYTGDKQLIFIGAVAEDNPLRMTVDASYHESTDTEQNNRSLRASILLSAASRAQANNTGIIIYAGLDETHLGGEAISASILSGYGEPSWGDKPNAFHQQGKLLVGTKDIMSFVTEHNDGPGQETVARFMDQTIMASVLGNLALTE